MAIPFCRFWKMYKAINVIRLDLYSESELLVQNALHSDNSDALTEFNNRLESSLVRMPRVRPLEERKRDAKNARIQFAKMRLKLQAKMQKTEEKYKKMEKKKKRG